MIHLVGVSGIHQIDTGSNLVPVLGLRTLSKCLWVYQSSYNLVGVCTPLCLGQSLKELSACGHQCLSGPNRPRFGNVSGGLFSSLVCKEKIALVLEPHSSVHTKFCWEETEDQ